MTKPDQGSDVGRPPALLETIKFKVARWLLATIDPVLFIFHVTLIYAAFLMGDTAILALISWSFGDVVRQSAFAQNLLEGIKLLSALGTASAYGLHLIYSLYQEARHVARTIRQVSDKEEIS